jgi:hypothetical protein
VPHAADSVDELLARTAARQVVAPPCRNSRVRSLLTRYTSCKVCKAKGTNVHVSFCGELWEATLARWVAASLLWLGVHVGAFNDHERVTVHHRAVVAGAQLCGKVPGAAAQQGRQFVGVVVHQAAGDN